MCQFTKKEVEDYYKEYIESMATFGEMGLDRILLGKKIVSYIDDSVENILEIGTGKGSLTVLLAQQSKQVTSVDIDKENQYKAQLLAAHQGVSKNVSFKLSDAQEKLYEDKSFDLVISAFSFHHFDKPFTVIDQMIRMAKKQVIITEFNEEGFRIVEKIHKKKNSTHTRICKNFDDVKFSLKNNGFEVLCYENLWQKTYVGRLSKGEK